MENTDYRVRPAERPTDDMWEVIGCGINQYNRQRGGCRASNTCASPLTRRTGKWPAD